MGIFSPRDRRSYLLSPSVFLFGLMALTLVWLVSDPVWIRHFFDEDGYSPFELATIPFFAAIVPLVWWKCPFTGSRLRRNLLCSAITCVAMMAVVKEMDLHVAAMHWLYPDIVDADGSVIGLLKSNGDKLSGTPFKMRFLTSPGAPLTAKILVVFYFTSFFGVFAATLAYFAKPLIAGVFSLHPVAWSVGCLGALGVLVQLCDRMPAWVRHAAGLAKPKDDAVDAVGALFTVLEEGGEMLLAIFALIAILQAYALYNGKSGE